MIKTNQSTKKQKNKQTKTTTTVAIQNLSIFVTADCESNE